MGDSDNKGDGLASQPRRYQVLGQPLLNRHQGGVSPAAQMGCLRNRSGAWRNRAPGPHAHRNTARQATDGLWTEARGQQKQLNDPGNNQHILNTPTIGRC